MPFKTKYGTHYHETEGCCGATESCGSTDGLAPCSICCGGTAASRGGSSGTGGADATGGSVDDSSSRESANPRAAAAGRQPKEPSPASDAAGMASAGIASLSGAAMPSPSGKEVGEAMRRRAAGRRPSAFEAIPEVSRMSELGRRSRCSCVRGGEYVVAVRDYEGGRRTNMELRVSTGAGRHGEFVRIDWEDGYWDDGGYCLLPVDRCGDPSIDDVTSFSDYEAKRGRSALRSIGMDDGDFRAMVLAAVDALE